MAEVVYLLSPKPRASLITCLNILKGHTSKPPFLKVYTELINSHHAIDDVGLVAWVMQVLVTQN